MSKFNINKRYEFLYYYDVKDANPNGDPDDNRPRIDEETGRCYVTDVRIKRTVRDYWIQKGEDVFIKQEKKEDGKLKGRDEKVKEMEEKNKTPFDYIDNRLFGIVFGSKESDSKAYTGPLQLKFAKSLNNLIDESGERYFRISCVLPSDKNKTQGTFGDFWIIRYGIFENYGIYNENSAKETKVNEGDLDKFFDGLWNGTKNLITRSKVGQIPRFLIIIEYKEDNFHIGDLTDKVKIETNKKVIEKIDDFKLVTDNLIDRLKSYKDKINKIYVCADPDVVFSYNSEEYKGNEIVSILKEICDVETLSF
jgi:CRISPR-associated protein Csh2